MTGTVETATEIRPFHIDIPQEEIDELRRRVSTTRWPTRELVDDRSQGVQLAATKDLARYWTTEYDWRRCEARLVGQMIVSGWAWASPPRRRPRRSWVSSPKKRPASALR
jgi:Epoxide hydrolase N terminus